MSKSRVSMKTTATNTSAPRRPTSKHTAVMQQFHITFKVLHTTYRYPPDLGLQLLIMPSNVCIPPILENPEITKP